MEVIRDMYLRYYKSVFAGVFIGLGGYVYLKCPNQMLGAFLFSIGLLSVIIFKMDLYTGKVCWPKHLKKPFDLLHMLVGNVAGALIMGELTIHDRKAVFECQKILEVKVSKSFLDLLLDGIICGICIAIAIKGFNWANTSFEGVIILTLAVTVFIITGSEHVVADMYYAIISDCRLKDAWFLIPVLIGNTIGGAVMSIV